MFGGVASTGGEAPCSGEFPVLDQLLIGRGTGDEVAELIVRNVVRVTEFLGQLGHT